MTDRRAEQNQAYHAESWRHVIQLLLMAGALFAVGVLLFFVLERSL
ncbi:MAG TPA: hypothetical protein VLJ39_07940 [Tepidisphaeraceae bacterium]|nr:hypothetical protein [Tepidisphaeraceae bacterium]